jgi:hypothetical protein
VVGANSVFYPYDLFIATSDMVDNWQDHQIQF